MFIITVLASILASLVVSIQPKIYQTIAIIRSPSLTDMTNLQKILSTKDFLDTVATHIKPLNNRINMPVLKAMITVIPAGNNNLRIIFQGQGSTLVNSLADEYVNEGVKRGNQPLRLRKRMELQKKIEQFQSIRDQLLNDLNNNPMRNTALASALSSMIASIDASVANIRYQLANLDADDSAYFQITVAPGVPELLKTRNPLFAAAVTGGVFFAIATFAALYFESRRHQD